MKRTTFLITITAIISSLLTLLVNSQLYAVEKANYYTLPYKVELIQAYEHYYISTEAFLDELESDYGDLMSGSDANADYLHYKVQLDSLRLAEI